MGAVGAIVLLKRLLREAVESECGSGAFETRGGDAPGAVGAAPSGESRRLRPRSSVCSYVAYLVRAFGIEARRRRGEHDNASSEEGGLLPVAEDYFPRNREREK